MLESLYIGMSGLTSYSKGLSNISNNVANLNTTGYKGSDLAFLDLFYQYQFAGSNQQGLPFSQGGGVRAGNSSTSFAQGDFRQTGNDLDAAVNGNGFFVVNKDGKTFYTRAGQFEFDSNGILTTRDDGARVYGIRNGALTEINISGKRSNPPKATTEIVFTDSLSNSSTTFDVNNIVVYDSLGKEHQLTLRLTNNSATVPGQWTFKLLEGTTELTAGEFRYDGSGLSNPAFNKHIFSYAPGEGASATQLTLDVSASNFFSSSASSLKVQSQNGYAAGFLSRTALDTDGNLVLTYSNGQTDKSDQLALAYFSDQNALQAQGGNRYSVFGQSERFLGTPGERALGKLQVSGIELSNVDLAQEFSELIIVQRGYQASSQVISAANEMIQQLGEIRGRR
ncbi:flagellar basal-body rod protein FlgF [Pseudomethylobacillus aquaticus]|uniref:Flagellar basal-body rod protein FlgF n=1 Tax=Pseudomethylobacillus aquaticus TaxID=2676064 RepID=A0A3N0V090_9PROT|nr:flagellar basal-body rod protein FlgF [Pseudomethylobacillus aquaticus]ROH85908.1 flagellar basal-body rod protein FlgF [Pseudomethylobacillus aquaticus]